VIAKFAFIVTPYPLILSMEIHCGTEQQAKMAKIFRETLGHELLLESLEGIDEGQLPSPEDLKYKILLKVCNISTLTNGRSKILRRKARTRFRIRAQTQENLEPNQIPSLK
jgi:Phosphatidylinositol-specific phospholipase C, X domain